MFRPLMTLAGASSLTLCATVSASAVTNQSEVPTRVINFQTEQLLTEQGVAQLRHTLQMNARMVCEPSDPRNLEERRLASLCAETAYALALAQLEIKVAQARSAGRNYAANTAADTQHADS